MIENAYSYLRVSGPGQLDGDGFPRQREAVRRYASANSFEIVEEFLEEAVPGKTEMDNRPALGRLMERLETTGVKVVLVENADRLARDLVINELIVREFQKLSVRVISASGGVDLTSGSDDNPTAKLIRQILAAVAEFDRCMIVNRTRAARERLRIKNGKCEGRKAYGMRPEEESILEDILTCHRRGVRADLIAATLNVQGRWSRYGKRWNSGTVWKIINRHVKAEKSPNAESLER